MDETTTTTVLASAVEALTSAMSESPTATEVVDGRSNEDAPIVIEPSPEPVAKNATSTATSTPAETVETVMVIDTSESSDDKNAVLVMDARQVGQGDDKNGAVDMVDVAAPVKKLLKRAAEALNAGVPS